MDDFTFLVDDGIHVEASIWIYESILQNTVALATHMIPIPLDAGTTFLEPIV